MHLQVEPPQDEPDPYQQLAQAVIMQAIQDATHRYRPRGRVKKHSKDLEHHTGERHSNGDQARRFLLDDKITFHFWCQVAQLKPEVVRKSLSTKLSDLTTYKLIRARHPIG